ncbi:MAG: ABC transporter permease [Pseudomonadaceae bacterium]|nr:ABC transporter permease [Pseudomonadaceae bacterium]
MHPIIKWTALTLAVCLPLSAQAHRAWMLPSATVLSGEDPWVTVDAAVSNDLFYFEHFPLRIAGIGKLDAGKAGGPPGMRPRPAAELQLLAPDGSSIKAENGSIGRYRSTFDVHLTQKGTYKLAIANSGLFANYTENGEKRRWMGKEADFAKQVPSDAKDLKVAQNSNRMEVFVTSGNPTETVLKTTGVGLELAPITHPNDLFAGEAAEFTLLLDGKPAKDVAVSVIPGGNRYRDHLGEIKTTSDADGKISITWPEAGMYWLEAELSSKDGVKAPATERRASYSATLEVLAP